MTDAPLSAHSIAEAKLYLLALACPNCDRGPVRSDAQREEASADGVRSRLVLSAGCDACGHRFDARFTIPIAQPDVAANVINPTNDPSRILDLSQWLTLSTMLCESARREPDNMRMRQLKIEAGLCLEEALKFYTDDGNDLPPPEAFFTDQARTRCRDNPDRFSRTRLRAVRLELPRANRS